MGLNRASVSIKYNKTDFLAPRNSWWAWECPRLKKDIIAAERCSSSLRKQGSYISKECRKCSHLQNGLSFLPYLYDEEGKLLRSNHHQKEPTEPKNHITSGKIKKENYIKKENKHKECFYRKKRNRNLSRTSCPMNLEERELKNTGCPCLKQKREGESTSYRCTFEKKLHIERKKK